MVIPVLAQLGRSEAPRLPDPPFLQHSLLESHWPTAALLLAIGLGTAWWLRRNNQPRRAILAAVAGLLLAVAVSAVGLLVTTEREVLISLTRDAVEAAAGLDESRLRELAAEDVTASVPHIRLPPGREALLREARSRIAPDGSMALRSHRLRGVSAVVDGPNVARTQAAVQVETGNGASLEGPTGTRWELHWRRDRLPGGGYAGWRVTSVHALQIGPFAGDAPPAE